MPTFSSNAPFNPNPISKILAVFLTGLTVMHSINIRFELAIICFIGILFYLNGYKKTLFKWIILWFFSTLNPILKMFLSIPIVFRMFLLPFMAASFMIKTSDVGTIILSMNKLKISKNLSIPIAVMFRFFPSFKEEKKNIKMAMRVREINFKNPIKYFEYVAVLLLNIFKYCRWHFKSGRNKSNRKSNCQDQIYPCKDTANLFCLCFSGWWTNCRRLSMVEIKNDYWHHFLFVI